MAFMVPLCDEEWQQTECGIWRAVLPYQNLAELAQLNCKSSWQLISICFALNFHAPRFQIAHILHGFIRTVIQRWKHSSTVSTVALTSKCRHLHIFICTKCDLCACEFSQSYGSRKARPYCSLLQLTWRQSHISFMTHTHTASRQHDSQVRFAWSHSCVRNLCWSHS